jgi:hypothetical protein
MYALTKQTGKSFEVLAVSNDKTKLRGLMRYEVLTFIEETYSNDQDALDFLMPLSDDMDYWSDEDELTPVLWKIKDVDMI